jgi:hypothetical protein
MNDTKPALPEPHEDVMRPGTKWIPYDEAITYAGQCTAAAVKPWVDALDDELLSMESCIMDGEAPRDALKRAIDWNVQIALDPAVSSDAQALIERGTAAAQARIAELEDALREVRPLVADYSAHNIINTALASTSGAVLPPQVPLPPEMARVLHKHAWELYECDGASTPIVQPEAAEPDDELVICPSCCNQFRAIPVQVQKLLLASGHEPPFLASEAVPHSAAAARPVISWTIFNSGGAVAAEDVSAANAIDILTTTRAERGWTAVGTIVTQSADEVAALATPPAAPEPLSDSALLDIAADFRSQHMHGGVTFDEFDVLGFARAYERALAATNGAKNA